MNSNIIRRLAALIIPVALAGGVTLGAGGTAFADDGKGTDHHIGQVSMRPRRRTSLAARRVSPTFRRRRICTHKGADR